MIRLVTTLAILVLCTISCAQLLDNGMGEIIGETNFKNPEVDVVVFLNDDIVGLGAPFEEVERALVMYNGLDSLTPTSLQVIPFMSHPARKMIYVPTGKLNVDVVESRQIYDNAKDAAKMVYSMGWRNPMFVLGPLKSGTDETASWLKGDYPKMQMALGALQGFYMPLILRETPAFEPKKKYDKLRLYNFTPALANIATAIETGRILNRDTCAADPQRMPPPAIQKFYESAFKGPVTVEYIADVSKYPMIKAVNRAVEDVEEYKARVIKMTYQSEDFVTDTDPTVLLVGKGITYDTGGANLKIKGMMVFMRKDKCGATSIAGFFKVLELLKPSHLKVRGFLAFVRNGIGARAYVPDEIIKMKSGLTTLIGNTDAEGRNVMVDMLVEAVAEATTTKNVHIFTIATLTGAVGRAFQKFTAIMDNGPARALKMTPSMVIAGNNLADIVEPNYLRKEDYEVNRPFDDTVDILQSNRAPNTGIYRGFQMPAGFMATASGLDKWGLNTAKIPYTHLDVSASVGVKYREATATPTTLFVSKYVIKKIPGFNTGIL